MKSQKNIEDQDIEKAVAEAKLAIIKLEKANNRLKKLFGLE